MDVGDDVQMPGKIPDGHEFALIDRIRQQAIPPPSLRLGIGDDAAVLERGDGSPQLLVTKDVLMEGVHFDLTQVSPNQVGRKALGVNLSDIAAMAGRPTMAFVGLVLPRSRGATFADDLMDGLLTLAAEFDVALAGGDTNIWDGPAVISVTLLGEPASNGPITRSGAEVGDWLMVTGALGGSLCGRHLDFTPRVQEARQLSQAAEVHAMLDLSDGLASDLQHLTRLSGVGGIVHAESIPIHNDVDPSLPAEERLQRALSDGEDFELLFAVSPATGDELLRRPPFKTPLTLIGECQHGSECWLEVDAGTCRPLTPSGWQHRFES